MIYVRRFIQYLEKKLEILKDAEPHFCFSLPIKNPCKKVRRFCFMSKSLLVCLLWLKPRISVMLIVFISRNYSFIRKTLLLERKEMSILFESEIIRQPQTSAKS